MEADIAVLKKATKALLLALCVNVIIKLFGKQLLFGLVEWIFICSGSDCNGILWWQRVPQLERAIWFLIDRMEDHNI